MADPVEAADSVVAPPGHDDPDELPDKTAVPLVDLARFDPEMLRSPVATRAAAVIVVASLVVFWPERSARTLSILIGLGLLAVSATSGWVGLRERPRHSLRIATALAGTAAGLFLIVDPNRSDNALGRLVAGALVVVALRLLFTERRSDDAMHDRFWPGLRTLALLASAGLLVAFPTELISAATTLVAIALIAVSVLVLRISFDRDYVGTGSFSDSGRLIFDWLAEQPKSVADREALYGKLLYDQAPDQHRIPRFFALMTFASAIASMGVITDSTAVVIGAMLIAPLMTPLMGMALSLVMGWPRRLGQSALIAFAGIGVAIGIGVLLGLLAPTVIDTTTNTQILGRASPTMLDLITAIAAGAAGAYGLSRPDVSDALPGVAIAISLVPPLSVVGISYSQGDWESGNGALLLFSTNMLAILVVGGLTFIVTGVAPIQRLADNQQRVRTSVAAVAAAGAMVIGLLLLNGAQITQSLFNEASIDQTIETWIEPHPEHGIVRVTINPDAVAVVIVGPANGAPTATDLAELLDDQLGRRMTADVRLIVEERDVATSTGED